VRNEEETLPNRVAHIGVPYEWSARPTDRAKRPSDAEHPSLDPESRDEGQDAKRRRPWLALRIVAAAALLLTSTGLRFAPFSGLRAAEEPGFTLTREEKGLLLSAAREVLSKVTKGQETLRLEFKDVPAALTRPQKRYLIVSIFPPGRPLIFAAVRKENLFSSTIESAANLARSAEAIGLDAEALESSPIKIDVALTEDLVWPRKEQSPPLSFELGVDGLYLVDKEQVFFLPPGLAILKGIEDEGAFINELEYTYNRPAQQWDQEKTRLYKFRATSFMESLPRGEAVALFRENVLVRQASREVVEEARDLAAARLLDFQKKDGSFHFAFGPLTNTFDDSRYGMVPHAEGALALLDLYKTTRKRAYLAAAQRALDFLKEQISSQDEKNVRYITWEGWVDLDANALAAAAFATYQDLTRKKQYQREMLALGDFLLFMQEADGSFRTSYGAGEALSESPRPWDAPAQALLALVRIHKTTGQERFLQGAKRAARFLIENREAAWGLPGPPPDAYLIVALEELHRIIPQKAYPEYGLKMARGIIAEQYTEVSAPYPDYMGGFSSPEHPLTSQAAFRLTGLLAARRLCEFSGQPDEQIEKAVRRTVKFLLTQQYRDQNTYYLANPEKVKGGFRAAPAAGTIYLVTLERAIRSLCEYLEAIK